MPKRRRSERDGGSTEERRRLYLVCDDWDYGYSIRKFSLPADSAEDAGHGFPTLFWRTMGERELPKLFTSAFGSKIVGRDQIIDVRERCVLTASSQLKYLASPIFFPVGDDRLFVVDGAHFELYRFHPEQPDAESDPDCLSSDEDVAGSDSQLDSEWSWRMLSMPDFSILDVTSYAMHPDSQGHSILVSIKSEDLPAATFRFGTGVFQWKHIGDWKLPFTGRGHYVPELRALVGLSKRKKAFGYLYACNLPTCHVPNTDNPPRPAWKRSKEVVLSKNPADEHVSASLIYLGYRSKFCLVECVLVEQDKACQEVKKEAKEDEDDHDHEEDKDEEAKEDEDDHDHEEDKDEEAKEDKDDHDHEEDDDDHEEDKDDHVPEVKEDDHALKSKEDNDDHVLLGEPQRRSYMYRLMTFSLKYDKMGDLRVRHCRVRYFKVPRKVSTEFIRHDPVVFWL